MLENIVCSYILYSIYNAKRCEWLGGLGFSRFDVMLKFLFSFLDEQMIPKFSTGRQPTSQVKEDLGR